SRDWSSDVCSSDLVEGEDFLGNGYRGGLTSELQQGLAELGDGGDKTLARPALQEAESFRSQAGQPLDEPGHSRLRHVCTTSGLCDPSTRCKVLAIVPDCTGSSGGLL